MSSDSEKSELQVVPLELKGRTHRKEKDIVRKVRQEHGTLIVSFPERLGLKLNEEVVIAKKGSNPLNWEIVIKPHRSK